MFSLPVLVSVLYVQYIQVPVVVIWDRNSAGNRKVNVH